MMKRGTAFLWIAPAITTVSWFAARRVITPALRQG
jgi:hypothetical protein